LFAYGLERLDVRVPVTLEVGGEIQERRAQDASLDEVEHDEQTTETTVAVQERVDRFELVVQKRAPDEDGELILLVQEAFEIIQRVLHLSRRRRNIERIRWTTASNPVLGTAKLARRPFLATDASQEFLVHVSYQPVAQREVCQALETEFKSADVVEDLAPIGSLGKRLCLGR